MTYTIFFCCLNTDWILQGNVWMCDAFRHTLDQECFASFRISRQRNHRSKVLFVFISGWAHEVHYAIKMSSECKLLLFLCLLAVFLLLNWFDSGCCCCCCCCCCYCCWLLLVISSPSLWVWRPSLKRLKGTSCQGILKTRSRSSASATKS